MQGYQPRATETHGNITFTLKTGAKLASLVSIPNECADCSQTFNVTGTVPLDSFYNQGQSVCAPYAGLPTPAPDPCAVQIDSAMASKISATLSDGRCGPYLGPTVSRRSYCTGTATPTPISGSSPWWNMGRNGLIGMVELWLGVLVVAGVMNRM